MTGGYVFTSFTIVGGGYLPSQVWMGGRGTYLGRGVPTLAWGYLPWLGVPTLGGGTYLGGGYLPWPEGYLPW